MSSGKENTKTQVHNSVSLAYFIMSTQETGGGLTKWQIAALIGAPVAVGCVLGAFYYWKSSQSAVEDQEGTENDTTSKQSDAPANEAPDSEDVSEQEQVH